jgi:hypothetical protein
MMPPTQPTILIISAEKEGWHGEMTGRLHTLIRSKARLVEAEAKQTAYAAFATNLTAVLVRDGAITRRKHRDLANPLGAYTKFSAPPDFGRMLKSVWSLPWRYGSYSREDSPLNEATSTDQIKGAPLPKMINVRAVYLKSVAAEEKFDVRGERITPRTVTQQLLEQ